MLCHGCPVGHQGNDGTLSSKKQLTPEQKALRVVLKRVNLDKTGVR